MKLSCLDAFCTDAEFFRRADKDCVCSCGQSYWKHPYCAQSELPESMRASSRPEYFLHVLCNGVHVKL